MRVFLAFVLCLSLLALPVSAFSAASSVTNETVVEANGSCQVTLTITLQLMQEQQELVFPLPENARSITINGVHAASTLEAGTRNVSLQNHVTAAGGTLTVRYVMDNAVQQTEEEGMVLTVPLLCGFSLPIEQLQFSITLPSAPVNKPVFVSTYYQEGADAILQYQITGNTIAGNTLQRLQDRESVQMTLEVDRQMFPHSLARSWSLDKVDLLMICAAVLAVLYWLAAMRCRMPRRIRTAAVPAGMNAGEVGCRLKGQGLDLTLTVLSWAQMGYLLIQMNDHGRVLLHKRMQMGNERTETEVRLFNSLFKKRTVADATGYYYARLCRKARRSNPARSYSYRRGSGNPGIFRVLSALIGALGGVSMALAYVSGGWRVALAVLLGVLGFAGAWLIQSGVRSLHHRDKLPLWIALGSSVAFLLVSLPAGEWNVALAVIFSQIAAGLGAFYGGMRTQNGQQTASELLGLRRYLRTATKDEIKRAMHSNPNYFYDIAPYALALDADRAFARQMGTVRLPGCTYLTTGMDGHMTAREFDQLLRDTVNAMDALQKRLPIDRLLGK